MKIKNGLLYAFEGTESIKIFDLESIYLKSPRVVKEEVKPELKINKVEFLSESLAIYSEDSSLKILKFPSFSEPEEISVFTENFASLLILDRIISSDLLKHENETLWLNNVKFFELFLEKEMVYYPLAFLLALKYNEKVIDAYLPLLSKSNLPFLKDLLTFSKINKKNKKANKKTETKKNIFKIKLVLDQDAIAENFEKFVIYILKQRKHPELGKYVKKIIDVHKNSAEDIVNLVLKIGDNKLKESLGDLLFEKIDEVSSELKNKTEVISSIKKDALLFQNSSRNEISSKLKENPSVLDKYDILTTNFPLDLSLGSKNSIIFFKIIKSMTSEQQAKFDELILYKWNHLKFWLWIQLVLFSLMTVCFNAFLYLTDNSPYYLLPTVFLNVFIGIYEIKCMITAIMTETEYFNSLYNWLDMTIIIGISPLAFINYVTKNDHIELSIFNFFFCLLLNIRSLTYYKVIDPLRYLVVMIFQIFKDISAFLIIIVLFILIYGIGLLGIDDINKVEDKDTFVNKIKIAIVLALGNWDDIPDEWNSFNWFLFLGSSLTFVILLLNLLIAIVSKTFDNYYENQANVDRISRLESILELDQFFKCGKNKTKFLNRSEYFHILKKQEEVSNIEELGEKIESKKKFLTFSN